jgi:hypothetical protein
MGHPGLAVWSSLTLAIEERPGKTIGSGLLL